ncbi:thioredoxin [Hyphomicrobiales bacterium]|jgi:putative thioredoxin|nr:thioredoxin [Hyphomicrobiales bacterium]
MAEETNLDVNDNKSLDTIKDSNINNFSNDVIESSKTSIVLVDFWAPWCQPCKQLTPLLEKITYQYNGKIKLVKINIDENQAIASQMGVQSIPAVFAFKDGKPIDGFMGSITENEILGFVEKIAGKKDNTIDQILSMAQECQTNGNIVEAINFFKEALELETENIIIICGLAECYLKEKNILEAEKIINTVPKNKDNNIDVIRIRALIEIGNQSQMTISNEDINILKTKIEKNPTDHQSMIDLSLALNAIEQFDDAIDIILKSIKVDKEWNDKFAQKQLLKFFDAWGIGSKVSLSGRRKLSAILFS